MHHCYHFCNSRLFVIALFCCHFIDLCNMRLFVIVPFNCRFYCLLLSAINCNCTILRKGARSIALRYLLLFSSLSSLSSRYNPVFVVKNLRKSCISGKFFKKNGGATEKTMLLSLFSFLLLIFLLLLPLSPV